MAFCESKILGYPEYLNSITSLFISGFGIYGLFNSTISSIVIESIYSLMVVIGLGSVGYHWFGTLEWRLIDETPMILGITLGTCYVNYVYCLVKCCKTNIDTIENFILIFTTSVFIVLNSVSDYSKLFPLFFGMIGIYLFYKSLLIVNLIKYELSNDIQVKITNSIKVIFGSAFIWILTEKYCSNSYLFLLGHPLWHFFIGYGSYNLIKCIYFIDLNYNFGNFFNLKYNKYYLLELIYNQ